MKHKYLWDDTRKAYVEDAILLAKDRQLPKLEEIKRHGEERGFLLSEHIRYLDTIFYNF